MLICGNSVRSIDATKTERASNPTLSQSFIELAVRLAEKESSTLFLSDGISPPPDGAKLINNLELDSLVMQFIIKTFQDKPFPYQREKGRGADALRPFSGYKEN